jgi:hypothetical protein
MYVSSTRRFQLAQTGKIYAQNDSQLFVVRRIRKSR